MNPIPLQIPLELRLVDGGLVDAAVMEDGPAGALVVREAGDEHVPDAQRPAVGQGVVEHGGGVPLPALGGADAVADVARVLLQILVETVPQLTLLRIGTIW